MHLDPAFNRCFQPLVGKPCWGVKPGYGSFITLEFGDPHLEIRGPHTPKGDVSRVILDILKRRTVTVRGASHLWIYACDWSISHADEIIGQSSASETIANAASFLDGQILTAAAFEYRGCTSLFEFDLGARLETRPYDDHSEQWLLYQPDEYVLTLRADKRFNYCRANAEPETAHWQPAWTP